MTVALVTYLNLTNNVVTNDITFTSGGIALGSYNITVLGNVTGVPNLMFNGSGVATGMSSNSYSDITNPNPTNIPPIVYDLDVDLGAGNTAILPNDVELTTFTFTSGSLNLNNHKITFATKGVALSSADAVLSALNISVNNTINYFGGQSIARTWTTSGTFTNAITLYLSYPSTETSANSVKVWKRNHGETGPWDVIGTFSAVDNGTTRTVAVTGITSLNSSSKGDLDWTIAETDQTLPVELSSFTCMITAQNYIMLDWVTQTETNVSGFYIYRNQNNDLQNAIRINAFINATNTSHTANYAFVDNEATPGNTWYYWLQHIDMDGESEFHGPVSISLANSGNALPVIPLENNLSVYPNPFNPTANIAFGLAKDAEIEVSIYNVKGERIKKLIRESKAAGTHRLVWDSRDEQGIPVASGIYFIRLTAGANQITQKMVLQK